MVTKKEKTIEIYIKHRMSTSESSPEASWKHVKVTPWAIFRPVEIFR